MLKPSNTAAPSYSDSGTGSSSVTPVKKLSSRQKDCLAGPDTQKKYPEKNTEQHHSDPEQSARCEFEFYFLFFPAFLPGHFLTVSNTNYRVFLSIPLKTMNPCPGTFKSHGFRCGETDHFQTVVKDYAQRFGKPEPGLGQVGII